MKRNLDYMRVLKTLKYLYNTGKSVFKLCSFYLGEKKIFLLQTFKESLLQYTLYIHGFCICGFNQPQSENILKTPESSKIQNLNLPHCQLSTQHLHRIYNHLQGCIISGRYLVAQTVKNPPAMWENWVRFLGWEDPLEEDMATHSNILAWRILTDRGAWRATVHGVAKSQTRLRD